MPTTTYRPEGPPAGPRWTSMKLFRRADWAGAGRRAFQACPTRILTGRGGADTIGE